MAKKQVFEYFFNRLVNGYRSVMGKNPEGLDLIKIKQEARQKLIDQNKVIEFPQKRSFGEEVDQMIAKGEVNIGAADKTPPYKPSKSQSDFEIQTRIESDNAKAIEAFKKRNPKDDMATGGRAGYYMGGQAMVGEDLSDVGHGSDALMARNMQIAPGGQATTSTGLNYLLGQDNDTARVPYNKGKLAKKAVDEGRRGFLKAAGSVGAGIAALKTGALGFADKAAPVVEKAVEAAGQTPSYFLKLVEKITKLGEDITQFGALAERQTVKKFKDYEMTTDTATGRIEIQKVKNAPGEEFGLDNFGNGLTEEVYMSRTPGEQVLDKNGKYIKSLDEYEEGTAYIRNDGPNTGDVYEEVSGVTDDIFEEVGEKIPEAIRKGQADGGRIGYNKGKAVKELIKAGEGKFTKAQYLIERIKNTIKGSPDDEYVQKTFPGFIDELTANPDLAKNENVFKELGGGLPEGQQIVVYGDDTLDFFTQKSGPGNIDRLKKFMAKHDLPKDQALRIIKMEPNDQVMELKRTKHLKQKRTDNSSGGLAAMLGE